MLASGHHEGDPRDGHELPTGVSRQPVPVDRREAVQEVRSVPHEHAALEAPQATAARPVESSGRVVVGEVVRHRRPGRDNRLGISLAYGEDFDLDGVADLWVGGRTDYDLASWMSRGAAWLFLGPFSGNQDVDDAAGHISGDSTSYAMGEGLAVGTGLLTGDGAAVAFGAPDVSEDESLAGLVLLYQAAESE